MTLINDEEFEQFFEPYAQNVDGFYEASYWRLCDEVVRELMRRHLHVQPDEHVLDAGGGTGRWARWTVRELGTRVTVADRSRAMLDQAAKSLTGAEAEDVAGKIELLRCDIEDAPELPSDSFDGLVSIYNMLSFNTDPGQAFATMHRVLKPGKHGLVMGQGFANALASKFNRDHASADEIRKLAETSIVQWAPHVPALRVFSADALTELATQAGFEVRGVFGVTSLITPEPEDFTYPYEKMSEISKSLDDPAIFEAALEQELAVNGLPGWADRGVNLIVHVYKP
ncbi:MULTISPECIES: methyltransferase domain-containing protein [unclassified Streptomyces]|uniref:class I SAM-dependent methyltransferase n=1 Tax=unclassified Streptomyces TaxID=2593676 RepID=UPI002DD7FF74|nr:MULTISPECIES: methyltransferase domain-containing protein [unclassified Streptomyces]WSA94659.1 methyltransferase domain-containing protein [Streptomyces sp. NBC_01795]WSB79078.1 methyltransferase domain-containing protein [Streptomyces sp. NBC_01775]WSS12721.1 methyltransferase domain-containing protein [Streptomyces sp. NBC_01186]WSS41504.1 methyltransferase domain-containing protein [Streptomyces sp. NBC_01187]